MKKSILKVVSICMTALIGINCTGVSAYAQSISDVVFISDDSSFDFFAERENGVITAFETNTANSITQSVPEGCNKAIDFVLDYSAGVPSKGEYLSTQFDVSGKTIDFSADANRYMTMDIYTEELGDRTNTRNFFIKSGDQISYIPFSQYLSSDDINKWTNVTIPVSAFKNAESSTISDFSAIDAFGILWLRKGSTTKNTSTIDHIYVTDMAIFGLMSPQNLNITGVNGSQVSLEWESAVEAQKYCVYRDGEKIATVSENSYTDSTVQSGAEYTYYITSLGMNGVESAAPDTGVSVKASAFSDVQVFTDNGFGASWTFSENAVYDKIQIYTNGILAGETVQTSFTDTTTVFHNGAEYKIELAVISSSGEEVERVEAGTFTYESVGKVQNCNMEISYDNSYVISWDSAMNAVGYNIYVNEVMTAVVDGCEYSSKIQSASADYTEILIPTVKVSAVNASGDESEPTEALVVRNTDLFDAHLTIYDDSANTSILFNSQYIATVENDSEIKFSGDNSAKMTFSENTGWQTNQYSFYSEKDFSNIRDTAKITFWAFSQDSCDGLSLRIYDKNEKLNKNNVLIKFDTEQRGKWKYYEIPLRYFSNSSTTNEDFDWEKVSVITFIGATSGKPGFTVNIDDLKVITPKANNLLSVRDDFNESSKTGEYYVINDSSENIKLTFSEKINAETITTVSVTNGKNKVNTKCYLSEDLKVLTVNFENPLQNFEKYSIDLSKITTPTGGISDVTVLEFIADDTQPVTNITVNTVEYTAGTTYTATANNPSNANAILFMIRYASDGTMLDLQADKGTGDMSVSLTTPAAVSLGEYILVYAVEATSEHIAVMGDEITIK